MTTVLTKRYGINRVVVSAYHPQANGMIERGHRPIADSLSKLCHGPPRRGWVSLLSVVLWADRTTIRASTGMTPYEFQYGSKPVLPIELRYPTWSILNWKSVSNEVDLVANACSSARAKGRRSNRGQTVPAAYAEKGTKNISTASIC